MKNKFRFKTFLGGILVGLIILSVIFGFLQKAFGGSYDLTTDNPQISYTIEGATWERFQPSDATGSGVFNSFLRVQAAGTERGYNTDYRPLQFDENSSATFTHSYKLKDVPMVIKGGVIYREFQLDINEQNNDPQWYLSLDKFQVWVTNNPNITGYSEGSNAFASGATKVYDLGDNWIKMDYRANAGSGKRDYRVLIPQYMFDGKTGDYVVIFTRFGDNFPSDDGFEEWGVAVYPGTISGYKFNDLNANGVWDAGEPGLNGWTIKLDGGSTHLTAVTANDSNGNPGYYSFTGPAGTYTISEVNQSGWIQTYPSGNSYTVTLGNGEIVSGKNFGNYLPQPSISITKTGDTLSKIGDKVHYTITITNTGNIDLEHIRVTDTLLGDISSYFPPTLATGASATYTYKYTVPTTASDPMINTVTVHADPAPLFGTDLTTDVTATATWETNLFQPNFTVTKTGNTLSKIGDTVHYTITVTNTSSTDTPEMTFHITDAMLGIDETKVIANGSSYTIEKDFVIPEGASDPFVNTVNVHATIAGFPNTYDKSATWETNLFQPAIEITKTGDPISKVGDTITYTVTITNKSSEDTPHLVFDSFTDSLVSGITLPVELTNGLDYGESVTFTYTYTVKTGDPDPLSNTATVHFHPYGFPNDIWGSSTWSVDLVHPNTKVSITPNTWETFPGGNVILTITEQNTGDCPIENVKVTLNPGAVEFEKSSSYYVSGDTNDNGILDVGETWTWVYQTTITADTTFSVTGYGNPVGLSNEITPPDYPDEYAEVTVKVKGATRTLGFWQTHLDFTTYVFNNYCGSYIDLGWKKVDSIDKVMGIFWANVAKDSTGKKRSALDQARMIAGQQALAAILNSSMPGGAPLPAGYDLTTIANTLAGTDINAIKTLGSVLGAYNQSGDTFALDPSLPPTGRANPIDAKNIANIPFAD
jgi:uncharacterized repeat protein (TIGR01451 family)